MRLTVFTLVSMYLAMAIVLSGCAPQIVRVPVDSRCQTQEAVILTVDEGLATPRSVLDKLNTSNCALWKACPDMYELPASCVGKGAQ